MSLQTIHHIFVGFSNALASISKTTRKCTSLSSVYICVSPYLEHDHSIFDLVVQAMVSSCSMFSTTSNLLSGLVPPPLTSSPFSIISNNVKRSENPSLGTQLTLSLSC